MLRFARRRHTLLCVPQDCIPVTADTPTHLGGLVRALVGLRDDLVSRLLGARLDVSNQRFRFRGPHRDLPERGGVRLGLESCSGLNKARIECLVETNDTRGAASRRRVLMAAAQPKNLAAVAEVTTHKKIKKSGRNKTENFHTATHFHRTLAAPAVARAGGRHVARRPIANDALLMQQTRATSQRCRATQYSMCALRRRIMHQERV